MIFVKSIVAGLIALAGAILLLLSLLLLLANVEVPVLAHLRALAGIGTGMIAINVRHAPAVAAVIFLLGFGWEYRRVKARQAN